jgi:hypothetical protein
MSNGFSAPTMQEGLVAQSLEKQLQRKKPQTNRQRILRERLFKTKGVLIYQVETT